MANIHETRGESKNETLDPAELNLIADSTQAFVFLQQQEGEYGYRAGDTKLGDAETIIFWYLPTGAVKHRALYADLHWADVTSDLLPKPLPAKNETGERK